MKLQSFRCPQCGGSLEFLGGDHKTVKCRFCGNVVIVPPELRGASPLVTAPPPATDSAAPQPLKSPALRVAIAVAVSLVVVAGLLWVALEMLRIPPSPYDWKIPTNQASIPSQTPVPAGEVTHNAEWTPRLQDFSGMRMALVPTGCFDMGSDVGDANQGPVRRVCLTQPFWIEVGEVTQGQFRLMGGRADLVAYHAGDALPRELVTWDEAAAFCELNGGDLPTEAQWEYAARGPDDLTYPWGSTFVAVYAVFSGNSGDQTASVFARPDSASWVGAQDMSGNVYEWTADWYGVYPRQGQADPTGPAAGTYRVLRGGSYHDSADRQTASARWYTAPFNSSADLGFRCARRYSESP